MNHYNSRVAVITINYNQSVMTIECVNSILKSDYNDYRIDIIDNGSNLESYMLLINAFDRDDNVHVYRIENNIGYVGGVNFGMSQAVIYAPDYFLIMNNDTVIDNGAIRELVKTADINKQNAIVSGKIYHFDRPDVFQYTGSFFTDRRYLKETYPGRDEQDVGQCDQEEERDMLDDIMWILPSKIYQEIGSYSNNFFLYAEQADYALQAFRKGYKLIYTPYAKIWHKGSQTTGDGVRYAPPESFWRNKSSVIYLYRNTKRRYFFYSIVISTIKLLIKNVFNLLHIRKTSHWKSEFSALIGKFYGVKWIFHKKPDNGYNPFLRKES